MLEITNQKLDMGREEVTASQMNDFAYNAMVNDLLGTMSRGHLSVSSVPRLFYIDTHLGLRQITHSNFQ